MGLIVSSIQNVLPFFIILTVLVFVHELGHFLLARWNGVKVEVFSIGFGPEIWGFYDRYGTRWRFSVVPLGGYVKMFGEGDMITGVNDSEDRPMTEEEQKVSFHHKSLGQRAAIVIAGPASNFLFAVLVLWTVNSVFGTPTVLSVVGEVIANTAAEDAGLEPGDMIVSINGRPITLFKELSIIVSANANIPLHFEIQRGTQTKMITATPRPWKDSFEDKGNKGDSGGKVESKKPRGLLGVRPDLSHVPTERVGLYDGLTLSLRETYALTRNILDGLGQMFSGKRSAKELGGVIMIAQVSSDAAQGGLLQVLRFLAVLSINLGLINLFPVPVLDGGHLVFYVAEALRGRPLSPQVQEYGFRLGLVLVLLLMLFATWNDFERLFTRFGLG